MMEVLAIFGWAVLLAVSLFIMTAAGVGLVVSRGFTGRVEGAFVVMLLVGAAMAWFAWGVKPFVLMMVAA
ncbi:MAG: hypothetical protein KAY06_10195 [Aeromonadaceae bacterium]|nr:hypothetical protein [Aeromonadaceae bacterium]